MLTGVITLPFEWVSAHKLMHGATAVLVSLSTTVGLPCSRSIALNSSPRLSLRHTIYQQA